MTQDVGEPLGFLEQIPPRDKEIVLLAPIYFYGKYMSEGNNAVEEISDILSNHPMRNKLFLNLENKEIRNICEKLDKAFETQEINAQLELWSYYDVESPEGFAMYAASTMLLIEGRHIGIGWFSKIFAGKDRETIMEVIMKEKAFSDITGLLFPGEVLE